MHGNLNPCCILVDSNQRVTISDFSQARVSSATNPLSNVFKLTPKSKEEKKRVADWLSRAAKTSPKPEIKTGNITPDLGTISYRAPEVVLKE